MSKRGDQQPAASARTNPIPRAYRLWFGTFEPIMGLSGFYFNHFNPNYLLRSLNPSYNTLLPITPETRLLLDTTTGAYAQNWFVQIVLPRARPRDVGLWKMWQGSLLVVDSILMGAILRNLHSLGLLNVPGQWRSDQWANVVIMASLIAVRAAFVLGFGFGHESREAGKKA